MKKYTIAVFNSRPDAEKAIHKLHADLKIPADQISYLYQNTENELKEVDTKEVSGKTAIEGAKSGAVVGGSIGALAGLATVAGLIPIIGPVFAAGPLIAALGIGAGVIGTTAAGGVTGAAAGGLIGALVSWSSGVINEDKAKEYEDQVVSGNVLVAIHADETQNVEEVLRECNALTVDSYNPAVIN